MKKINNFLYDYSEKIILIFLFLQPIIDVLTAISLTLWNFSFTVGLSTRFIFMIYMLYYCFFLSKSRSKSKLIYLILLLLYILIDTTSIIYLKGFSALGYELKSTLKSFYFPIVLVGLLSFFQDEQRKIDLEKLSKLFIIYALFVIVPNLLGIGFESYAVTKSGSIGLFYTANEIGAILSILMVSYLGLLFNKEKYIQLVLSIFIILYMLTSIGTKGPLLLFILLIFYYLIKYLKSLLLTKKYKLFTSIIVVFILCISVFCLLIPKTSFYKNIKVHLEFLNVDSVTDIITSPKVLDHFIFSQRLSFWKKTNEIYMNSKLVEKILGIGYISNYSTDNVSMKMVEMDFVDIFYRHGILGFILYFYSFIIILVSIIKKMLVNKNKSILVEIGMISIIFSILLAFLTGHVLMSPSVSIFVALIISLLYNEVSRRDKKV